MFNPFSQGGWNGGGSSSGTVPQPSIFGALPYPTQNAVPTLLPFRITSFNPTILQSTITGANLVPYFRVRTDTPTPGFTVVHNAANEPTIVIEWARHPVVEIRGVVSKRRTKEWLVLSADKTYRTMRALGKTFVWAPDGATICLYSVGLGAPQLYAQVSREEDAVILELTAEAVQIGLLGVYLVLHTNVDHHTQNAHPEEENRAQKLDATDPE
ncbi:hypothetical protein DFH07DRAFT_780867 [Mycena maculata]|uniref:Uncharacterized protein n=1 Tax=Mycena maculata TaxID=230809 RepID=A0AAD7I1A0_9AGAR|nr:hypothetical protein DFH07DRAFT_780867 [Mycena maculata]